MDALIFVMGLLAFWIVLAVAFKKMGFMKGDEELLRNDRNKYKRK